MQQQQQPQRQLTEEEKELTVERDEKVKPVVTHLFSVLAEEAKEGVLEYGSDPDMTQEDLFDYYQNFYEEFLIKQMLEQDLTMAEADYVFRLMRQPIDMMKQVFDVTIDRRKKDAMEKLVGEQDIDDVTLEDLNDFLQDGKSISEAMEPGETARENQGLLVKWAKRIESMFN